MKTLLIFLCLLFFLSTSAAETQQYQSFRGSFQTHLLRLGPSPQPYTQITPPNRVNEIEFPSGSLKLKGWLALPANAQKTLSAVVYLHGGYAFDIDDYRQAHPFLEAGYAVLFPFLRGENGNPGNFEMLLGEVDDALAAVRWLRNQPGINPMRIAVFGHSIGGATSELTSLASDDSIFLSGSIGALYPQEAFQSWRKIAPFDTSNPNEVAARTFILNLPLMKRRHIAYLGAEEPQVRFIESYRKEAAKHSAPLSIFIVPGDHLTSIAPAIQAFIGELRAQSR